MDLNQMLSQSSAADRARIMSRLDEIQMEATFQAINSSIESCFNLCVQSFRSKNLDSSEKECLQKCTGKYIACSERIGARFQEAAQGQ